MTKKRIKEKKPQSEAEAALVVNEAEQSLKELDPLPKRLRSLKMNNDENYEKLMSEGRTVRNVQRAIEKKETWAISGMKEAKKSIDSSIKKVKSLFVPMINACREVLEIVGQKQVEYENWQEAEYEKEQEKLRKEAEEEQKRLEKNARARAKRVEEEDPHKARMIVNSVPEVEVRKVEVSVAPKVEGVVKAKVWNFEVTDPSIVPQYFDEYVLWTREFNRGALLKVRVEMGFESEDQPEGQPIEGIRFFQVDQTRYGKE